MYHWIFLAYTLMVLMLTSKVVYLGAAAGAVIIVVVAIATVYQSTMPVAGSTGIQQRLLAPLPHVNALGFEDAEITIVEFGDYRCIHCARFNVETKDTLISKYADTGKLKFLFRDFPINDTPNDRSSAYAAEASYCAAEQGKYWEYHDRIFRNFDFERNVNILTKDVLEKFASEVGVTDTGRFSDCLESGKYSSVVEENYELAKSLDLKGTPAFIILPEDSDPVRLEGFQTIKAFEKELDRIRK